MATPAPADDVVIKTADSDPDNDGHPAQQQQQQQQEEEEGPAVLPLSTQEQLQAIARRREAAVSFRNQVGECRLALRYSVIGWTGTLDPDKIPTAISNAPSIHALGEEMNNLERKLAPFLPADNHHDHHNSHSHHGSGGQGLGAEALGRVERVRAALLAAEPGRSTRPARHIAAVLRGVERDARAAGLLPPQDGAGWVWSLSFDDWFVWRAGERAFVSARRGVRTDFVP